MDVKFDLFSNVRLKEIDRPGFVEEINISINGLSYRLAWWNNGERYSTWVNEFEIEVMD